MVVVVVVVEIALYVVIVPVCCLQSLMSMDNCNGGDIHRPLIPKPADVAMSVPSCRYINLSHSPSDNRSTVDDADDAAVHIRLRRDDEAGTEPRHSGDTTDSQSVLPPAEPISAGYIVVSPDTFGCIDPTTGHVINADSGIENDDSLRWPHGDDGSGRLAKASNCNPQNSDLAEVENDRWQPSVEVAPAGEVDCVNRVFPSVDSSNTQGNSDTVDSVPVTDYAMIVGMDVNDLGSDAGRQLLNNDYSVGQSQNEHRDEPAPSWSVSDEERRDSPEASFNVTGPPVCYSLNSGGYLSHSELLGAAPAV